MSLNQVINGVDEIITGTPKYNITDNGDGTKGIELANEVVQQGTPIAKQVLDKIDNVLSYLTPSVEKNTVATTLYESSGNNDNNIFPIIESNNDSFSATCTNELSTNVKITGSAHYGTTAYLKNAFDNNNSTYYNSNGQYGIELDFEYPIILKKLSFTCYKSGSSANGQLILEGTNDDTKTIWNSLANTSFSTTSTSGQTNIIDLESLGTSGNYKHYRVSRGASNGSLYMISFTTLKWEINYTMYSYQNQFTLDNNGQTFVNNQRVLIEPKDIITTIVKSGTNNLLPTSLTQVTQYLSYDGVCNCEDLINVNISANGQSYNDGVNKLSDGNTGTIWNANVNDRNQYCIFKFDKPIRINKFTTMLTTYNPANFQPVIIKASNDGTNYVDLYTITTPQTELTDVIINNDDYYTYYSFYMMAGNTGSGFALNVNEIQITEWYYEILHHSLDLDGVTSNTLNGIDIPTLLQPSTKYELIYKEDSNKFEIKNNNIFDITLSENVSEIQLPNGLFKDKSIYIISIFGNVSSTSGIRLKDSHNSVLAISGNDNLNLANTIIFSTNFSGYSIAFGTLSSYFNYGTIANDGLKIATAGTSYLIPAGTRIIIKEVA